MDLISAEIHSLKVFFGFKQLIKAIPPINHAATSGEIVDNASESLMIQFRKYVFSDCLNFLSGVAIDKSTVVSLCIVTEAANGGVL